MPELCASTNVTSGREIQLATFYVDDLLLGLEIYQVQEINRLLDVTTVPHSPKEVLGVINLRGEVVTVVNLRTVLGIEAKAMTPESRNLIVSHDGELIGLCVDRIADILSLSSEDMMPAPTNISAVDGRFFTGVFTLDNEIIARLNLFEVLELAP